MLYDISMDNSGKPLRIISKSPTYYNKNTNVEIIEDNKHVWPINTTLTRKLTSLGNNNNNRYMEPYNLRWANEFAKEGSTNTRKKDVFNRLLQKQSTKQRTREGYTPVVFNNSRENVRVSNKKTLKRTAPKKFNILTNTVNRLTGKRTFNKISTSTRKRRRRI